MAKKTVKAGMNKTRDGLVDMGTVPGTVKTLVRVRIDRGRGVGVGTRGVGESGHSLGELCDGRTRAWVCDCVCDAWPDGD